MGDQNQDRLQQQQNDTQRPQAGQQNQQADRERRLNGGVEGADQNGLNTGAPSGGSGDLRPEEGDDTGAQR